MLRLPRSPGRLVVLGVVLLWVVTPLMLGGLITVAVRAHNGGGIGTLLAMGLLVWALVSALCLLAGFGSLVSGVLVWWRGRHSGRLVAMERSEVAESDLDRDLDERLGL